MINSSPLDLAEGSFAGAATVEPTSPTTIDAEVREASAGEESGKPTTTEPTKTTNTVENVTSPRKRGRQEVDELRTSPAKPTKKRRKKEGHDKPSEAGEKEEVVVSAAPEENGEKRRKTAQDEELREQEETLARRLAELDEERQRVKEELERVKSQREQLRADLNTTPTTKTAKPKRKSAKKERKGKEEADSTTHAESGNAEPENGAKRSKRKREDKKEEQEEEVAEKKPEEPAKTKAKTKRRKKADNAADPVEEKLTNAEDEIVDIEGDGGEVKGKEKEKESTAVVPAAAKASFKWRAGFVSITGGRPENQDAYIVPLSAVPVAAPSAATSRRSRGRKSAPVIVEEVPALSLPALPSPTDDLAIFGVLDGHGLKGQYAAQVSPLPRLFHHRMQSRNGESNRMLCVCVCDVGRVEIPAHVYRAELERSAAGRHGRGRNDGPARARQGGNPSRHPTDAGGAPPRRAGFRHRTCSHPYDRGLTATTVLTTFISFLLQEYGTTAVVCVQIGASLVRVISLGAPALRLSCSHCALSF